MSRRQSVPDGLPNHSGPGERAGALPDAEVSAEVDDFLNDGPPPVLVTLGSALSTSTAPRLAQIGDVLDRRGLRALFFTGQDPRTVDGFRDRPGVAEFAPLASVLPRCRAVIHHGGYGTSAAALGAGVPSVVTPFMPDQQWYGRRIEAVGTGIVVTPRRLRRDLDVAVDHVVQQESQLRSCDQTPRRSPIDSESSTASPRPPTPSKVSSRRREVVVRAQRANSQALRDALMNERSVPFMS